MPFYVGLVCGGVGHFEYPGAEVYFNKCLEECFDQLMVGQDCVAWGNAVQRFFWLFKVHFHGRGWYVNIYPFGKRDLRE